MSRTANSCKGEEGNSKGGAGRPALPLLGLPGSTKHQVRRVLRKTIFLPGRVSLFILNQQGKEGEGAGGNIRVNNEIR